MNERLEDEVMDAPPQLDPDVRGSCLALIQDLQNARG
jgi:hypothetical protein